jgi:uncharacterized protein YdhG (YjbR/CyaY superfamily)
VDDYMAAQPDGARRALDRVRSALRKALPTADEVISYQIPAYKQDGRTVVFFAGWKEHYSLYPASRRLVAALGDDLARYEISKGTIRFPLSEPVPVRLVARIAKLRAEEAGSEAEAKRKPKTAKPKTTKSKTAKPKAKAAKRRGATGGRTA